MIKQKYDFLIIGSGLAGLYTAHYASNYGSVVILSKTTSEVSNSYLAQGGIAAVIDKTDKPEYHFIDTITAGRGLCNKEAVNILVTEAKDRIEDLLELGMDFDSQDGELLYGLEGGHSRRRVIHAGGDSTGKKLVDFLTEIVLQNPKIDWLENTLVHNLITNNNRCYGAHAFNYDLKKDFTFLAKNTILATGGASAVYKRTTNPFTSIGDGLSLAFEAGAQLESMEFIQFHPTAFYTGEKKTFLISEAVRGEGAYLLNSNGERFMENYHELKELAPRDIVSIAIYKELQKSNKPCVYLSLKHLDSEKIKKRFSTIFREALKYKIDITKDLVPVAPAAHYTVGGIKTGLMAETNIKGLFACGEVASSGIHGANRLASNSLLECLVFGKRAIDIAIKNKTNIDAIEKHLFKINFFADDNKKSEVDKILENIAEIMNSKVGLVRTEQSLNEAENDINSLIRKFNFKENEYLVGK